MEREERRLDDECGDEPEEEPAAAVRPRVDQVERAFRDPEDDHGDEHQERAGHRVGDELERRPETSRPAPVPHEDVERDQHRLERRVEEHDVLGREDGDDRARQEEHEPEVAARAVAPGPEAVRDRRRHDCDRQPGEPERETVETDVVGDVQVAEPVRALLELQPAGAEVEADEPVDPDRDLRQRHEQPQRAGPVA